MRTLGILAIGVLFSGAAALALPPGPLDGLSIPSDFAGAAELAVQTNRTGFGDQVVTLGAYTPGTELDGLFLAKDNSFLRIGITGNVERNGHAFVIFIDADDSTSGLFGQDELRAEYVDGPPFAVQTASREVVINTNGPGDPSDDTWNYGSNGTVLPFAADFAIAVDGFGGTASISVYNLFNPLLGAINTTDPTPDNAGDADLELYGSRIFVGQTSLNDGNDVLENLQDVSWGPAGFDDTNTTGVTSDDAAMADAATTGLELSVPLALFQGATSLKILAIAMDGGGSTGVVVPQALPPVTDLDMCTSGAAYPLRADISGSTTFRTVTLASLPTFVGTSEGVIRPAEYGLTQADELQTCPTPYGDQIWDPGLAQTSAGSELDVLYADNDDDFLYLGITGNLQTGGNRVMVFIDTDPDLSDLGQATITDVTNAPGGLSGMSGDTLPEDLDENSVNFNYAYAINLEGGSGDNTWVDYWDMVNLVSAYRGQSSRDSGDPTLMEGSNPNGMLLAYSSLNYAGVPGDCWDAGSCANFDETPAEMALYARSATQGFEMAIPLADLGLTSAMLPQRIRIWTYVTGDGGWGSNQSLPPMRNRVAGVENMVGNGENGPNNYSDRLADPLTARNFDAWAAEYMLTGGLPDCVDADVNCDGSVNGLDIAAVKAPGTWLESSGSANDPRGDVNGDDAVNGLDIAAVKAPGTWLTSTGFCTCP